MDNTLINLIILGRVTSSKNVAKEMSSEPLQRQKQINEAWSGTLIFFLGSFFWAFFSVIFSDNFF